MKKIITSCVDNLINGKVILYPTDTVWGIGCDSTNKIAVDKIYKLKKREESKSMIVLVDSMEMLRNYVDNIPNEIKEFLKKNTNPLTIIYNNPKNLAENLIAKDNTIAIRIVKNGFVYQLIKEFGKPIVSTSANVSGEKTPLNFNDISSVIKSRVDFVVDDLQEKRCLKSSKIIKFVNGEIKILRS